MELEFDKYCVTDCSPTTVLKAPRNSSKAANKKSSVPPKQRAASSRVSKDFREISFNRYRSASCRHAQLGKLNEECNNNALLKKRGSVYQSSKEVNFLKKTDYDASERKKIEFSPGTVSEISFGIIDSCISDENRSVMSRSEQCTTSASCKNQIEFLSESVSPHSSQEREVDIALHKPLSSRIALSHSDNASTRPISTKVRFNSSSKTFDPFAKSKSHRSPLSSVNRTSTETMSPDTSVSCEEVICNDIPEKPRHVEMKSKMKPQSDAETSPAHLSGILKINNKHGLPSFEFVVKSPEEFYLAKTWKTENELTRVYTFHSLHYQRRKSNASGWGHRDSCRESTILGQMHISCYRRTELNRSGKHDDTMVTEFVLYDVSHSRGSNALLSQDCINRHDEHHLSTVSCKQSEVPSLPVKSRINTQSKYSRDSDNFRLSNSKPIPSSDWHPVQEIAAIVLEVPVEKRESLKFKTCDDGTDHTLLSLLELCQIEQVDKGISDISSHGTMHIVVPCGNHGSPLTSTSETTPQGPNLLLERWRLDGGCDCGGWDMACPLNIFQNSIPKPMDDRNPVEIFHLGKKDDIPAFTMRSIEDGKYAVNFHAQLSSPQAFSICVAILHSAEESSVLGHDRSISSKQTLQSDSVRVFPEEEIKNLIDSLSSEEDKLKLDKKPQQTQSFVVNPPF